MVQNPPVIFKFCYSHAKDMPCSAGKFAENGRVEFLANNAGESEVAEKVSRHQYKGKHEIYRGVFRKCKENERSTKLQFRNAKAVHSSLSIVSKVCSPTEIKIPLKIFYAVGFNSTTAMLK